MNRTITLSEARAMASDSDLIQAGDVGAVAILATVDGQESLVDLSDDDVDTAAHEWARRMGTEDDEGNLDAAVIVAD